MSVQEEWNELREQVENLAEYCRKLESDLASCEKTRLRYCQELRGVLDLAVSDMRQRRDCEERLLSLEKEMGWR